MSAGLSRAKLVREPVHREVATKSTVTIADAIDVRLAPEGAAVVVRADAVFGDQRAMLEPAITTGIAPNMAVA